MSYTIWGRDKTGRARCFALHVPPDEEKNYLKRAEEEGWTDLVTDHKPQPSLFGEDDPTVQHEAPEK